MSYDDEIMFAVDNQYKKENKMEPEKHIMDIVEDISKLVEELKQLLNEK